MIYIIIWAIISTGDVSYINPTYKHVIVAEEHLAEAVQDIKSKAWQVDIKIYKAFPVEYEYYETLYSEKVEKHKPYIKFKEPAHE